MWEGSEGVEFNSKHVRFDIPWIRLSVNPKWAIGAMWLRRSEVETEVKA